jgi:hypothetical protein
MTNQPVLLALAIALLPAATLGAQGARDLPARDRAAALASAMPAIDSVARAAVAAMTREAPNDAAAEARRLDERQWVGRAKWTLLAAAAAFGGYALANSRTEHTDRRAQLGILGGQISLLGSVGLFIYDLRADHETPENIPFEQSVTADPPAVGSGARDEP